MTRRRQDREPEARLRWERGADWVPASDATLEGGPRVGWRLVAIVLGVFAAFCVLTAMWPSQ